MTQFYAIAFFAMVLGSMVFGWPWLVDQIAATFERTAGLLRRHATAMRAAYRAYTEAWRATVEGGRVWWP
jgi:hypothetical protein